MRPDTPLRATLAVLALTFGAAAQIFLTEDQALALAFPRAEKIEKHIATLSREQQQQVAEMTGLEKPSRIFRMWVGRRSEEVLGYAVLDDVRGKARPIDFMLVADANLVVQRVEILAYRETHGWQIRKDGWRQQFVGKGAASTLRVGRDIRNIAGATISCRSLTDGVRRDLAYLSVIAPASLPAGLVVSTTPPPPQQPVRRSRLLMGTTLQITAHGAQPDSTRDAVEAAFDEVQRIENILSSWKPDSALSRLNREAGRAPAVRDATLLDFMAQCVAWAKKTDGAVDPTVGPLVELWREAERRGAMPTGAAIARAREHIGWRLIALDPSRGELGLTAAGSRLDAGAIGKGYALDRAAAVLRQHGTTSGLLNFGGQVLAMGPQPDGEPWRVTLRSVAGEPETTLSISSGSIATTADDQRARTIGVNRVSHIIDPRTGQPVEGSTAVTVHCPTATEADALSTALFVMGFEAAVSYADGHGIASHIRAGGHSRITNQFRTLIEKVGSPR